MTVKRFSTVLKAYRCSKFKMSGRCNSRKHYWLTQSGNSQPKKYIMCSAVLAYFDSPDRQVGYFPNCWGGCRSRWWCSRQRASPRRGWPWSRGRQRGPRSRSSYAPSTSGQGRGWREARTRWLVYTLTNQHLLGHFRTSMPYLSIWKNPGLAMKIIPK